MEADPDIRNALAAIGEELPFPFSDDSSMFLQQLSLVINNMINRNLSGLIALLYRLDVDEMKLRQLLEKDPANAGDITARLIFERQLQKIKSRREFRRDDPIDEMEKW